MRSLSVNWLIVLAAIFGGLSIYGWPFAVVSLAHLGAWTVRSAYAAAQYEELNAELQRMKESWNRTRDLDLKSQSVFNVTAKEAIDNLSKELKSLKQRESLR
jgi:hypothetical protein